MLDKLDFAVRSACTKWSVDRLTLVAHSAGGLLVRIYLGDRPLIGKPYRGVRYVDQLVTLGTPHHNLGGLTRGGLLASYAQRYYPNAYHEQVRYTSLAGRAIVGNPDGTAGERRAAREYARLCGNALSWGDGLIPTQSALLSGANHVTLDGVHHFGLSQTWYGTPSVVHEWWDRIV